MLWKAHCFKDDLS